MGVALILAPLMLIVFLIPVFYVIMYAVVMRTTLKNLSGKKKTLVSVFLVVIFLFSPTKMVWDFVKFSNACHRTRSVISVEPIKGVTKLAFITEHNKPINSFMWARRMNLNLDTIETATVVNNKISSVYLYKNNERQSISANITSRYRFKVTAPSFNDEGILVSKVSVVDGLNGIELYSTYEYVYHNLATMYYADFFSTHEKGVLSCGYLGPKIGAYRSVQGSVDTNRKYRKTDSKILTAIFPDLQNPYD